VSGNGPQNAPSRSILNAPTVRSVKRPRHPWLRAGFGALGLYGLLLVWALFTLLPLAWMVAGSLTTSESVFKNTVPFTLKAFIPDPLILQAYIDLANGPFARATLNSLFVCAATVVLGLVVNSLAGFAFAFFEFRFKTALFALVLLTFMIPFEVIALPLYSIVTSLRFDDSFAALILPALSNGLVIFLFRQFFLETPRELLEAARVDGLSWWGIYVRIVLPLSLPVMISGGLVLFISQWDAFYWPLLVATSEQYQLIQVALANFRTQYTTHWNQLFAGSVVAIVIPATILLMLQRNYISSIASTGVKE
jgi:multiple sugar transport system permease protein